MRKLVWGLLGLVVGLQLLSLLLLWLNSPEQSPDRFFNPKSLERITEGMMEAEVIEVLGVPPGNYINVAARQQWRPELHHGREEVRKLSGHLGWNYREWLDDRGGIVILFDEKSKVVWKFYQSVHDNGNGK